MQRGAAKLVLEVDVRVSIEEQLGDVVVVLGAGLQFNKIKKSPKKSLNVKLKWIPV